MLWPFCHYSTAQVTPHDGIPLRYETNRIIASPAATVALGCGRCSPPWAFPPWTWAVHPDGPFSCIPAPAATALRPLAKSLGRAHEAGASCTISHCLFFEQRRMALQTNHP